MTGALIVFAREPRVGHVKTRLAANLGHAAATDVYAQLLSRTLRLAERSQFSARYLFAADAMQIEYFENRLEADRWQVRAQCDGDIGQRMHHALESVLCQNDFVVLIGSDVADSEVADLDQAWTTLSSELAPAVVGPSVDGGYWLVGLKEPRPEVFYDIPWSTNSVLATTIARMASIGLDVSCLTPRHDVDKVEDLRYLA